MINWHPDPTHGLYPQLTEPKTKWALGNSRDSNSPAKKKKSPSLPKHASWLDSQIVQISFQINTNAIELQMNKHKVDQIPAIQIHLTLITKTEPQTKKSLSTFMPPSHGLIHTDKENQTFPWQMPKQADPSPSTKLT
jgi:hypothetical protein